MRIRGVLAGRAYDVTVRDGEVTGSVVVARLVRLMAGRLVTVGPTGPRLPVSLDDPRTVVALLRQEGTVHRATGVGGQVTRRPGRVL